VVGWARLFHARTLK